MCGIQGALIRVTMGPSEQVFRLVSLSKRTCKGLFPLLSVFGLGRHPGEQLSVFDFRVTSQGDVCDMEPVCPNVKSCMPCRKASCGILSVSVTLGESPWHREA